MINRQALLADLQKFLQRIEADLLERSESTEVPEVPAALHAEYEKAAKAERTAQNYEDWRTDTITQAAAAWVLSCVFVRFLEDNSLIDPPKIAGPGERLARARDEHELYFRSHPQHTDREYLLSIFGELAKLPGTRDIFGEHNAINDLPNWLSGDAAGELLNFFQKINASTGDLVHNFTDPNWDTRFLGDLYQDLSEAARKKYALLQTPDFVEEFILDRTLDPALDDFGLTPQSLTSAPDTSPEFKMIDPACGSGHFLLGSFPRILNRWLKKEPSTNIRELTQRTLNSIHGVDINPFAVAIARFRLLLAALKACDVSILAHAPAFSMNVACGDSLYHGRQRQLLLDGIETDESHYFKTEDADELKRILREGTFHAVVANPPYIVPKDRAANAAYRGLYRSCQGKYSLSVPFMERILRLAIRDALPGYTGQITSNSFMKREFGKTLVESYLPTVDLTHVLDTSGAYLPGHGTPTLIIFARNRPAVGATVRSIQGIQGEPTIPDDPSRGEVWLSIRSLIDQPGQSSMYVSSLDVNRNTFDQHPWTLGGGGISGLREVIESSSNVRLSNIAETAIGAVTLEDDVFTAESDDWRRRGLKSSETIEIVEGDRLREWQLSKPGVSLFPHDRATCKPSLSSEGQRWLWSYKTSLSNRVWFGKTQIARGLKWFEFGMISKSVFSASQVVAYGEVATHNHFVVVNSKKSFLFNRTAPVILPRNPEGDEDTYYIAGIANSSTIGFWLMQVCMRKGGSKSADGARLKTEMWTNQMQFNTTKVGQAPFPDEYNEQVRDFALQLSDDRLGKISVRDLASNPEPLAYQLGRLSAIHSTWLSRQICIQEDLDWACYQLYGLLDEDLSYKSTMFGIQLGERAFEIVMARRIARGELATSWFERHGSKPITELPVQWPDDYKALVNRRITAIESNANIALIEQPEYKRRWNIELWETRIQQSLLEWLVLRLETYFDFDGRMTVDVDRSNKPAYIAVPLGDFAIYSVVQLADAARRDPQFMEVGELYRNDPAFDVQVLVEELVLAESVPQLPILCYKDSGLRKRAEWERTWDLQRREDAGESVGTITVPPKYISADFISTGGARYWSLRGKLDVPKERWISFPHCEGPDGTLVICWAGYDHLQQAQAISAYYVRVQTEFGGSDDPRLIPLLASLIELLPWLKQWHNEPNANFDGLRMGDYFEGFVNEEARNLGKTLAEIKAWVPPKKVAKAKAAKVSKNVSPPTKETNG